MWTSPLSQAVALVYKSSSSSSQSPVTHQSCPACLNNPRHSFSCLPLCLSPSQTWYPGTMWALSSSPLNILQPLEAVHGQIFSSYSVVNTKCQEIPSSLNISLLRFTLLLSLTLSLLFFSTSCSSFYEHFQTPRLPLSEWFTITAIGKCCEATVSW